jgi:hypothetical protein
MGRTGVSIFICVFLVLQHTKPNKIHEQFHKILLVSQNQNNSKILSCFVSFKFYYVTSIISFRFAKLNIEKKNMSLMSEKRVDQVNIKKQEPYCNSENCSSRKKRIAWALFEKKWKQEPYIRKAVDQIRKDTGALFLKGYWSDKKRYRSPFSERLLIK